MVDSRLLTLEVALFCFRVAREGPLRFLVLELIEDLPVGDIAHLEVLLDQLAFLVAHAALPIGHHSIASVVCFADVAVETRPAVSTLAIPVASSWCSVLALWQRATQWLRAVLSSKPWRTAASSTGLGALSELMALEVVEVAVEAWRAPIGSIAVYRE